MPKSLARSALRVLLSFCRKSISRSDRTSCRRGRQACVLSTYPSGTFCAANFESAHPEFPLSLADRSWAMSGTEL